PLAGFHGLDSFTYQASDGAALSNPATASITVTRTLSIPTNITGAPGTSIVVPVNIDNPDPATRTGMVAADVAILYDPSIFTVATTGAVAAGSVIPATGWSVTYGVDTTGLN